MASTGEISIFPDVTVKEVTLCLSLSTPRLSVSLYRSNQGKYVIKDAVYLGYALYFSVSEEVHIL